jgi:uncharacterized protein (DUF169 family)
MADLKVFQRYGDELERRLRLKTFPLALKLLEKKEDVPDGALRPMKDLGHHLSLCQTCQLSRRDGRHMAMFIEDHWCFVPVIAYGLGEPPDYFLQGHSRYPKDVATLAAGRHYAEELPRLEVGKYVGIVCAPLKTADFEPDVVMIYCDSAQLNLLLLAREYKDGFNLKCALSPHAACVYGIIPAIQRGDCQVAVPCRGDHYRAVAGDDEMIFSFPKKRLDELMVGLRWIEETGSKLPQAYSVLPEYPLHESYAKIAKMMGII